MKKAVQSENQKQTSFKLIISLLLIGFVVAYQPLRAQLISHAVGLYSGPNIVDKSAIALPAAASPVTQKKSLSSLTASVGTWSTVASLAPHQNAGVCLLLSDGRVLCHSFGGTVGDIYDILTPDINGSYINGTWSQSAESQRWRYAFSSDVLKDGRVYVGGGEYGTDGVQAGSHAEVYNPVTNAWSAQSTPGNVISDGNSEILPDGRILQALLYDFTTLKHTAIFDPVANTFSAGPDSHGVHNESMWLKLPDNSILMVDMQRLDASYTFTTPPHSERYIPSTNTWVVDADVPVDLYDPFGYETGPALLLPDGRAFFMGSSGHTAYYTPSGTTSPGTWAAGPDMPNGTGMPDAPAAMMNNGKILFACSPKPSSGNTAPVPTYWYEFDYLTNTYTQINDPQGGTSNNDWSQLNNLLNLPDGSVLEAFVGGNTYYVYTPDGSPLTAGKPAINNIIQTACDAFTITGTQFNGISEGSAFGDENQSASNYPLVRLTSGSNVYYARTFNWNSTGVQRGSTPDTTYFILPAGLPVGTYSLVVVANGIASDPVSLTTGPLTWYNDMDGDGYYGATQVSCGPPGAGWSLTTLGPDCNDTVSTVHELPTVSFSGLSASYCLNDGAVTLTGNFAPGGTFSGDGITDNGNGTASFSPASATAGPHIITYSYTIAAGCGSSSSQTVTVNDLPSVSFSGLSASYCIDGGAVTLTGIPAGGTFSGAEISGNVFNPASAGVGGPYSVTYSYTDGNGCSNSSSQFVSVNALPVVSFTGLPATICVNAGTTALTGIPSGGTFSGTGISGNTFDPASAGVGGPYSITYSYTDGNGCSNSSSQNITVNPIPDAIAAPLSQMICSGSSISSISITGSVVGTAFNWTRDNTASVTGIAASGTGNISGVLTNTTNAPVTVTFTITPTANGCSGTPIAAAVLINPAPIAVATPSSQTICSGSHITTIVLTSSMSGTTYSWTRDNTVKCKEIAASGTGNISGTLTNLTNTPVTVIFTITPAANGCTGTPITATVLVNPKTYISGNPANQSILAGGNALFNVTATGTSITYQWQVSTNGGFIYSNLTNGVIYSGATTATLNLVAVPLTMNGYKYRCGVKGTCSTATSWSALLTVSNPCQNATGLTTTNITTSGAKLNWVSANNPDQWQVQYKTTNTGSVWKDVFVAGNARTVTLSSLLADQNYKWHIRAKCGTNWTDYSAAISFKTLETTKAEAANIPATISGSAAPQSLKVYPNPTKGEFTVTLQVEKNLNPKAKIQLVNMMGKTVYTEDADMSNGNLHIKITPPASFAKGVYILRVLIDDKLYKTQVIFSN